MVLKTRFCAKCGKETDSLLAGLCSECYLEKNPVKIPSEVSIKICPKCSAIKWRGVWVSSDKPAEYYLKQLIEQKVKLPKDVILTGIEILKAGRFGKVELNISVKGELVKIEKKIDLTVDKFACSACSRQKSEWLAKIQVRRASNISVGDILAVASKHRSKIIRTEEKKNGIDFYFFTRSTANKLASKLIKRFGFSIKKSYEQHGHDFDTGRAKHREIISLR